MRGVIAVLAGLCLAAPALAQGWHEPARGSAERRALMDAARPIAEDNLGAPIEFVVHELRVLDGIAFAMLQAQRPGGGAIDLRDTPMAARGDWDPYLENNTEMQVLYRKSGSQWVAVHWGIAPTDVWWAGFCDGWGPVIPEACQF